MKYKIKRIDFYNKECIDSFYNYIYKEKREKIFKIKVKYKKVQSIIGEILLKELLQEKNISYKDLMFSTNDYGKPYITNSDIFYNISHSFEYIVTIISDKEIGIDIEKIRKTNLNCVNQFATPQERKYITANNQNIEKKIFEIYTLKEAYFKMKGNNLNNIKNVEFNIINNNVICSDKNVSAYFINDLKDYVIAVCEKK